MYKKRMRRWEGAENKNEDRMTRIWIKTRGGGGERGKINTRRWSNYYTEAACPTCLQITFVPRQAVAPCPQVEHRRPHSSNSWRGGSAYVHTHTHTMHRQMFEIWIRLPFLLATRRYLNTQHPSDWLFLSERTFYASDMAQSEELSLC
jgi:hypothetical protein